MDTIKNLVVVRTAYLAWCTLESY